MTNKLPIISTKKNICIVCEGDEEYEYLEKLLSLHVWNDEYDIVLENAEGNGNIPARYQDKYQNGAYDVVLAFCNTDRKPYEQYIDIKRKINEFHGFEDAAKNVLIYGNPCTMQIIIEHWDDIKLPSHLKKKNAPIIEQLIGLVGYKGKKEQREELFSHIDSKNYKLMSERIKQLPDNDEIKGSSNFGRFIDMFSSKDDRWIAELNKKIEEE